MTVSNTSLLRNGNNDGCNQQFYSLGPGMLGMLGHPRKPSRWDTFEGYFYKHSIGILSTNYYKCKYHLTRNPVTLVRILFSTSGGVKLQLLISLIYLTDIS